MAQNFRVNIGLDFFYVEVVETIGDRVTCRIYDDRRGSSMHVTFSTNQLLEFRLAA